MGIFSKKKQKKISDEELRKAAQFTMTTSHSPKSAFQVTERDFISPTMIKETTPKDLSDFNESVGDYFVEIGTTHGTKRYYKSLFAELSGGNTHFGMLDKLYTASFGQGNLDADMDIAIHVIPIETATELDNINRRIRGIKSDLYGKMPDEKRLELNDELRDLSEQRDRLRLNVEKAFRSSIQLVLSSNSLEDLQKYTNVVTRSLVGMQVYLRSADGKQLDAFLNLLPIKDDPTYIEHTHSFETSNLTDLFPFGNGKISHSSGIVWGVDHMNRPIMYDAWDKSLMNRNFVITGTSGGGKTFAASKLIHHDVLRGVRHAIICPKGDYRRYVEEMGCPYFDFGVKSTPRINFFDVDIEEIEVNGRYILQVNLESTIAASCAIIFKMVKVYDTKLLDGVVKRRIEDCIKNLYEKKEITREPDSIFETTDKNSFTSERKRKTMPILSDLIPLLEKDDMLKNVAEILSGFTQASGNPERAIFDGQSNVSIKDTPIFAFGLADLDEETMRPIGLFIATKWLATKFSHKNRQIPKRVVVDECQIVMMDNETAKWLENEFKIVRFFNTSMGAITQGFEAFTRSDYGIGILKNAPTKLYLRQDKIDDSSLKEKFSLSQNEIDFLIQTAKQGLGILHINNERSIIRVTATLYEEWLFETEPNRIQQKREAYERSKKRRATLV